MVEIPACRSLIYSRKAKISAWKFRKETVTNNVVSGSSGSVGAHGERVNTKKLILRSYLSYLFRLRLLSKDSCLLEGLQNADKIKMHPKAKLQNAPIFTGNGNSSHVCEIKLLLSACVQCNNITSRHV